MKSNVRLAFALVMICFFISGVAGLVYQVAWARYLALFLGHTSYAIIAVLVAFMGGLALGNAALGFVADRVKRPLALYGWLELGIAVYAFLFPAYYEFCHSLYVSAARHFVDAHGPLLALKFAFSFLTIVLPTTLMGATFPALTCFVTNSLAELRGKVASLYFINSLGAVVGCFVADFWWIPKVGLELTVFGGAGLNVVAGIIALGLSRATLEGREGPPPAKAGPADEYFSARDLKVATIAIGASGFVAMLYEVAWTRVLALALGSSTHAFSIMLVTFISGIALGAAIIARWKSLRRTMDAFGWAEMALAIAVLISMFTYEWLPFWFIEASWVLARRPEAYPFYELAQGLICFIVMFIPAICLGMTLPLASRIATAELAKTGRSVGKIFAVNTLGTVLGAAVTGLWLMPTFGLASTFAIGFVINALIGAAIIWRAHLPRVHGAQIATAVIGAGVIVWAAGAYFDPIWRGSFTQGIWRIRLKPDLAKYRAERSHFRFLYYKDGADSTVTVHGFIKPTNYITLRVNGKVDASSGDTATQLLLGHLPCLMHTTATNALVVGLGSGMTPGAILRHTNIQSVQVVEISPEVAEAATYFKPYNDAVLENPRFRLAIDDAKSFLAITPTKYDIIVNEPSNPWMAGVAAVFSREFYETAAAHLAQNGVMIQWVQVYETDDETLQTVMKTFGAVFPHMSMWRSQTGDLVLVGTLQPREVDLAAMITRMGDPRVLQDLERGGFSEPVAFLARELISPKNCVFVPKPEIPVHSDYYPTLEYRSQRAFFVGLGTELFELYDETKSPRPDTLLGRYLRQRPLTPPDFQRLARAVLDGQITDVRLNFSWMQHWSVADTNSTLPLELIERLSGTRPAPVAEELRLTPRHEWLLNLARTDITPLHFYERVLMRSYRYQRTALYLPDTKKLEEVLKILLERDPVNRRVFNLHLAELAWDKGNEGEAFGHGMLGFEPDVKKGGPHSFALDALAPRQVLTYLIETSLRTGQLKQARDLAAQAVAGNYLQPGEYYFAPLELACRKTQALFESAAAPAK